MKFAALFTICKMQNDVFFFKYYVMDNCTDTELILR